MILRSGGFLGMRFAASWIKEPSLESRTRLVRKRLVQRCILNGSRRASGCGRRLPRAGHRCAGQVRCEPHEERLSYTAPHQGRDLPIRSTLARAKAANGIAKIGTTTRAHSPLAHPMRNTNTKQAYRPISIRPPSLRFLLFVITVAPLSSEMKCNTPCRFDIGRLIKTLGRCCHAMLFAFVG
jgi:hypothetical protein